MENSAIFDNIIKALQGVTVLEAPRVSRETIVTTLREHTLLLRGMKTELSDISRVVTNVSNEAADNRRALQVLTEDSRRHKTEIERLFRVSEDIRKEVLELGDKISELYVLKQQFKDLKSHLDTLTSKFQAHTLEMSDYVTNTNRSIAVVDKKSNDIQFELKELKEYVDHFGDNLVLPSSQIRVETSAKFSSRPITLLEVLTMCSDNFEEAENSRKDHDDRLVTQAEEISKKAPDSIVFNVHTLEKKVTNIEYILQKEEEQGIGAIRRQCEQLTADVQGMIAELNEKVTRDNVSFIVHEKYEEIVKYLQDALQSSAEDEQNFKAKADELEEQVAKLMNTKVDRMEFSPMQEVLVKTEAMLKKINSTQKSDKAKEPYTRKEIDALLELKVDKDDFDNQVQSVVKGAKKKKLTALVNPMSSLPMSDDIGGLSELPTPLMTADAGERDKAMWKGIADAMKEESETAVTRSASRSQTPTNFAHRPEIDNNNNNNINNLNNSSSNNSNGQFAAYIQSKRAQQNGKGLTTISFPSNQNPGAFRAPSEAGRPGGLLASASQSTILPSNSIASLSNSYLDVINSHQANNFPMVPPDGEIRPNSAEIGVMSHSPIDTSFLTGRVAGGGFNLKSGSLQKAGTLKNATSFADNSVDLEASGFMLRGKDGHLYYTDDGASADSGKVSPPTAKPLLSKKAAK